MSVTVAWAILGIALIAAEVATGTFILLFFGVGALVVSGLTLVGLDSIAGQVALFAVVATSGLLFLRKKLASSLSRSASFSIDGSQVLTLEQPLAPREAGQISYQGSTWAVVNASDVVLARGARVVIQRIDGTKLLVRPEAERA